MTTLKDLDPRIIQLGILFDELLADFYISQKLRITMLHKYVDEKGSQEEQEDLRSLDEQIEAYKQVFVRIVIPVE